MSTIGTLPGDRLAGLLADTCHKIQHGGLTLNELALFNQRKNPFPSNNRHGHIVLTIEGRGFTGKDEIWAAADKFRISNDAKSGLLSTNDDGYDKRHCLGLGVNYRVVLMPTREIVQGLGTVNALRKRGVGKYGYKRPLGGIASRIFEAVSYEQMGFKFIVVPHDSIRVRGIPSVFYLYWENGRRLLDMSWDVPDSWRDDTGAAAFLDPAS